MQYIFKTSQVAWAAWGGVVGECEEIIESEKMNEIITLIA